jgi:hypothetical protein
MIALSERSGMGSEGGGPVTQPGRIFPDDEPLADDIDPCGYSVEHDLREIDSRDGLTTLECRNCGAELTEEVVAGDPVDGG